MTKIITKTKALEHWEKDFGSEDYPDMEVIIEYAEKEGYFVTDFKAEDVETYLHKILKKYKSLEELCESLDSCSDLYDLGYISNEEQYIYNFLSEQRILEAWAVWHYVINGFNLEFEDTYVDFVKRIKQYLKHMDEELEKRYIIYDLQTASFSSFQTISGITNSLAEDWLTVVGSDEEYTGEYEVEQRKWLSPSIGDALRLIEQYEYEVIEPTPELIKKWEDFHCLSWDI